MWNPRPSQDTHQRQDLNPGIWRLPYPKKWHHRYGKPTLGLPSVGHFPSGNPGEPLDFHDDFVQSCAGYLWLGNPWRKNLRVFWCWGIHVGKTNCRNHPPGSHHHFKSWYVYHSQSWVVHGFTVWPCFTQSIGDRKPSTESWWLSRQVAQAGGKSVGPDMFAISGIPKTPWVLILKRSNDLDDLGQVKLGCQ